MIENALTQVTGINYVNQFGTSGPDIAGGIATIAHAIYQLQLTQADIPNLLDQLSVAAQAQRYDMVRVLETFVRLPSQSEDPLEPIAA